MAKKNKKEMKALKKKVKKEKKAEKKARKAAKKERKKLSALVQSAHMQGKKIRFWGTLDFPCPARKEVWRELLAAAVDLINTDDLKGLREFLTEREVRSPISSISE